MQKNRARNWWKPALCGVSMLLGAALPGCAQDRYLSAEQDAEMRATCEPQGCAVIPSPVWQQIRKSLGISGT